MDMSSFATVLQSLQQRGQEVRSYINRLSRKKAVGLSQVLREEVAPVRKATKEYMQALFETDRDLVKALRAANKQVKYGEGRRKGWTECVGLCWRGGGGEGSVKGI